MVRIVKAAWHRTEGFNDELDTRCGIGDKDNVKLGRVGVEPL
jgi:hypothetical protein